MRINRIGGKKGPAVAIHTQPKSEELLEEDTGLHMERRRGIQSLDN